MEKFTGLEPDAPTVQNEKGGYISDTIYRCDLIDAVALLEISRVLKQGARNRGEGNWRRLSVREHLNHLIMHVFAYLSGNTRDDHLAHAACRAIFALAKYKRPRYLGR